MRMAVRLTCAHTVCACGRPSSTPYRGCRQPIATSHEKAARRGENAGGSIHWTRSDSGFGYLRRPLTVCTIMTNHTHPATLTPAMCTNIVIDPALIAEAMRLSGAPTKRQAVEESLRLMVRIKRQEQIRSARGKLRWVGDLEAMRRD